VHGIRIAKQSADVLLAMPIRKCGVTAVIQPSALAVRFVIPEAAGRAVQTERVPPCNKFSEYRINAEFKIEIVG
jgi:hypothetical protein